MSVKQSVTATVLYLLKKLVFCFINSHDFVSQFPFPDICNIFSISTLKLGSVFIICLSFVKVMNVLWQITFGQKLLSESRAIFLLYRKVVYVFFEIYMYLVHYI